MTYALASINPFLAHRYEQFVPLPQLEAAPQAEDEKPVYVMLPRAPKNASPVPHLTSLYPTEDAGS
jgi:hypothetical protein